jgi:hypothetical protein
MILDQFTYAPNIPREPGRKENCTSDGLETTNNKNYILHMNGGWTWFLIKNIGVAELRNVPGYNKIENGELNKH